MHTRRTVILNKTGLHARPASDFMAQARRFKSEISIKRVDNNEEANAKSIMMLLSLSLTQGKEIEIMAEGEDEVIAIDTLVALVESRFGEED